MDKNFRIAVLIDGDNAESLLIENILNEIGRYGRITIKRIYADWTNNQMNQWKSVVNKYAIRPIQKFSYTKGKNSTDTALIIDAMDILHSKIVDGFCIVSSDSDYTGIAHRIREEGLFIMGIGKSKTPEAFVKACENFIYSEILIPKNFENDEIKKVETETKTNNKTQSDVPIITNKITNEPINIQLIDNAFGMVVDDISGLALASRLSESIRKIDTTFDIRNFGFSSFRKFCEALYPRYESLFLENKSTLVLKRIEK